MRSLALILGVLCSGVAHAKSLESIAIIGDSGATGAVSNPSTDASISTLVSLGLGYLGLQPEPSAARYENFSEPKEFNVQDSVPEPHRIWYIDPEVEEDGANEIEQQTKASKQVDVEENSWGYLVGRKLDVPAGKIMIAAQDGQRINSIEKQFARIRAHSGETLPQLVMVSYTANDFCAEETLDKKPEDVIASYQKQLKEQFAQAISASKAHKSGTDIVLLAPFPVVSELTNESILEKEIPFHDGPVSCKDLRSGNLERKIMNVSIPEKMAQMCPAVMKTRSDDKNRLAKLDAIFKGATKAQEEVISELASEAKDGFRFQHIRETSEIELDAEDVANDCFHPGIKGHAKIARAVLSKMKR